MFSATVRRLKSRRPSGTSARPSRTRSGASRSLTARPANLISPLRGTTSPATVFRSVVFPAPFAPISATISPGCTASETPWRASTPAPYATSTPRTSRSAPSRDADGAEADGVWPVPPRGAGSAAPTVVLAEIGLNDRVVPDDLRRRALGDLLSVVEDDDPLGEGHHDLHDVLDHAQRQAELAVDPAHQLHRGRRLGGSEPRHGLVEQEQAGLGGERPRDLEPLLVGQGQVRRDHVLSRREPGELEEPERARPRLADPRVALERAADDVLEHRHPAECAHELPGAGDAEPRDALWAGADRKSTRLNSSHLVISYAVFCLKKKKTKKQCQ